MKQKTNKVAQWFNEERIQILLGFMTLIFFIALSALAVIIAQKMHNYFLLSIATYFWVMLVTENFLNKYLFKKLCCLLLKQLVLSKAIFFLISCNVIFFSYKYLGSFILSSILAFIYGEFCRLEREKNSKK